MPLFPFYQRARIHAAIRKPILKGVVKIDRLTRVGKLIVNADDFGLTSGVNQAIAELHGARLVTSTTLMARAQATGQAIRIAQQTPSLGAGCHIALVDGAPVLSPSLELPHLTEGRTGCFRPTLGRFLPWLFGWAAGSGSAAERAREIEAEAAAQIALLQAQGLQLTHIDTHKHVHMFPAVLRPVLRAAERAGIRRVRNPFEPAWSVRATPAAPWLRRWEVHVLRRLEQSFRKIVAEAGFQTTDGALGVVATGTLDARTVHALAKALPAAGVYELVSHPGYHDAELERAHTRLRASREAEREALTALGEYDELERTSFAALG